MSTPEFSNAPGKWDRILLCEDLSAKASPLQTLLDKIGYEVIVAKDGQEALALLSSKGAPHLAVVDVHVSSLSAIELCHEIKPAVRKKMYIILLTRWNEPMDRIAALEAGADDCLPRPVDVRELWLRLEKGRHMLLERALQESEGRFRSAFRCAGIGMGVVHLNGEFSQVNDALCQIVGQTAEAMVGGNLAMLVYPDEAEKCRELLAKVFSSGEGSHGVEIRMLGKLGEIIWTELTIAPTQDAAGQINSFVIQIQDTTRRKNIDEVLRGSLEATKRTLKELTDLKFALDQHAIVATTDARGKITYVNGRFCQISKYSPEELLGKDHRIVNSAYHSKEFFGKMYETIRSGKVWHGEIRNRAKDGKFYWVDTTIVPFVDESGKPSQYTAVRADITERKYSEEALHRSKAFLQAIMENIQDLIMVSNADDTLLFVSPSCQRALGYEPEELLGRKSASLVYTDDVPTLERGLSQMINGEGQGIIRLRYVHKDGSWRHVECSGTVERSEQGVPERIVMAARLIDERLLAERKLKAAHTDTELIFHAIPSMLIGLDGDGKITRWNQAASRVLGKIESVVKGKPLYACGIVWLHPDMEGEVKHWLKEPTSYRCDDLAFALNGKKRYLGLNIRHIPRIDPGAEGGGTVIITGADITEKRHLEEQLRQAQKLEAIGQLSAGVAHEINTPTQFASDNVRFMKDAWQDVANLIRSSQEMRQASEQGTIQPELLYQFDRLSKKADIEYLMKEIPSALDQSQEGLQRIGNIVKAIKEFSHPGSSEKKGVDLNKTIETTITVARNEWKYVADLDAKFDPELGLVPCLSSEFSQVVLNLIVNASHAIGERLEMNSSDKGRITITTRRNPPWAEVDIHDTGKGIPQEIRSRIFEPFFTTKEVGKGTGQGLALAHSVIVNRHQGQIWFDSEEGVGTTFHIRIPLEAAAAAVAGT